MRIGAWSEAARRAVQRLTEAGSPKRTALLASVRALETGALSGPLDYQTRRPPSPERFWVRHLDPHNLWIFYTFDEAKVYVRNVSPLPPIPADNDEPPPSSEPPDAAG